MRKSWGRPRVIRRISYCGLFLSIVNSGFTETVAINNNLPLTLKKEGIMDKLLDCSTCGGKFSAKAKVCPHCGEPSKLEKINQLGNDLIQGGCALAILGCLLVGIIMFVLRGC